MGKSKKDSRKQKSAAKPARKSGSPSAKMAAKSTKVSKKNTEKLSKFPYISGITLSTLEQVEVQASDDSEEEDVPDVKENAKESEEDDSEDLEAMEEDEKEDSENSDDEEIDLDDEEEEENEDDDEDEDEDEDDSGNKLKKDVAKHKKELEALKKQDPEFYKFLEKEEADLLDFDMSDEDIEENDDDEQENNERTGEEEDMEMEGLDLSDSEDEDEEQVDEEPIKKEPSGGVLTKKMVSEWVKQLEETQSLKVMKKLLAAFKTAARISDEEQEEKTTFVYRIDDPNVLNKVIMATLRHAPIVFNRHLTLKNVGDSPSTATRWPFLQSIVKSYLQNLLHLLRNLTDYNMLYLAVKESEKCTAYWACFERQVKEYLKILLDLWSRASSTDHVRIQCFLAIRSLAVAPIVSKKGSTNFLDVCLKNVYLTFVRNCKSTNQHTLPAINLMRNLAVELYGINKELSYQQAFIYIRQLAVHLRGAMQLKTKESYKSVYNWQYIHCVDFWANVLGTHCQATEDGDESPLKPLIYPLVQIALGAVRLIPTGQYYPLRFHIIRCLISLNQSTEVYIPLAPYVIEVFENSEVKGKAKPSTLKPLEWDVHLKAPQQYLHSRVYQDGILEQVHDCLLNYYKCYFHHIAFPEMVIPGIIAIKRFIKKTKNVKCGRQLHSLVQKLEKKAKFIEIQRSKVEFSPVDSKQVKEFLVDMRQKLQ
ncbi:Nucleolar Complex 2 protein [Apophysomyces sp. BC1015]|nr:Nucleolar Complex 2 protein [Apophysomyces sp. BC1015]